LRPSRLIRHWHRNLYRKAIDEGSADWSAHASWALGELLEGKGDAAGAEAAWQRVIDSRDTEWARPAFTSLVNLLWHQADGDGLRAAYLKGAALNNPDALYALLQLGQLLEDKGDIDGAHQAWQQAIDAGCEDADYWRERMSPTPRQALEPEVYPADLPPEFNPRKMIRTGIDVLEHGLLPLPAVLRYEMAIPVAYWMAERCAVVLVLRFADRGRDEREPMALQVSYSRGEDGRWQPPTYASGTSFSHDPIRETLEACGTWTAARWCTEVHPGPARSHQATRPSSPPAVPDQWSSTSPSSRTVTKTGIRWSRTSVLGSSAPSSQDHSRSPAWMPTALFSPDCIRVFG
jgi:hypothetical protein